jgi:hypothetical protein
MRPNWNGFVLMGGLQVPNGINGFLGQVSSLNLRLNHSGANLVDREKWKGVNNGME